MFQKEICLWFNKDQFPGMTHELQCMLNNKKLKKDKTSRKEETKR